MYTIRMHSKADMAKGHGVLSAYEEQVSLVKKYLGKDFKVKETGVCDIHHFHTINPEYLFVAWSNKLYGRKNVGYVHFLPETLENSIKLPKRIQKLFYKYVLYFYKQMDELVTVNPYFVDILENKYQISRERVTYIPNVVSTKKFYQMTLKEKEEARQYFQFPNDKFIVLCAGQLQRRKGIFDFVETAKRMPDVQFVWAGDFSFGKISQDYEDIKKILSDPPENVTFLGFVEREDMNLLYNACDLFFLPSYEELFPMTILEAMACKIPIVVRELELYKDILFDYVQYAESINGFEESIRKANADRKFYKYCSMCSELGSYRYGEEVVAQQWEAFYLQLVTKHIKRS